MIPNGNCRHCSKSGRVVDQKNVSIRHDYVVRELILRYDFGDELRMYFILGLGRGPRKNLVETTMQIDLT
jgi:hypothetical protein